MKGRNKRRNGNESNRRKEKKKRLASTVLPSLTGGADGSSLRHRGHLQDGEFRLWRHCDRLVFDLNWAIEPLLSIIAQLEV